MNYQSCDEVKQALIDFIEQELGGEQGKLVQEHLCQCENCNQEYKGLRAMLEKAKNIPLDDPGEAFWKQLPLAVLEEVKLQKAKQAANNNAVINNNVVSFESKKRAPKSSDSAATTTLGNARGNDSAQGKNHWFAPVLAIAATVLLAVNVLLFTPKPPGLWFDQARFQANLSVQQTLSGLVKRYGAEQTQAAHMGFASQQYTANGYVFGLLLAESFIYLQDKNARQAQQRLEVLLSQLQQQQVPAAVTSSLRGSIESLGGGKNTAVALKFLQTFQQDYETYLSRSSVGEVVLYRAGIWSFNVGLAAAVKNGGLLQQADMHAQLSYLQQQIRRANVPAGVSTSLTDIDVILAKDNLSARDYKAIEKAIENIRSLLV
ncbi:zf-HC2 domain-containing protein [Kaarinaea lacus]